MDKSVARIFHGGGGGGGACLRNWDQIIRQGKCQRRKAFRGSGGMLPGRKIKLKILK